MACGGYGRPDSGAVSDTVGVDGNGEPVDLGVSTVHSAAPSPFTPSVRRIEVEKIRGIYQDLPSVLEGESGISVRRSGGFGEYSDVSIRGSAAKQVQVCIDGVPVNSAAGGVVDLSTIPLGSIRNITVYKNAAPLELMGENVGGVIDLSTMEGAEGLQFNSQFGSYDYFNAGMFVRKSRSRSRHRVILDYSYAQNDYPFIHDNGTGTETEDDFRMRKPNNQFYSGSVLYGCTAAPGYGLTLHGQGSFGRYRKGIYSYRMKDREQSAYSDVAEVRALAGADKQVNRNLMLGTTWNFRYKNRLYNDTQGHIGIGAATKNRETFPVAKATVSLRYSPGSIVDIQLSGGGKYESYSIDNLLDTTEKVKSYVRRLSGVGGLSFSLSGADKFHSSIRYLHSYSADSVRFDTYQTNLVDIPGRSAVHNPAFAADLKYSPAGWLGVFLGSTLRRRTPSFSERYGTDGTVVGNPSLAPETKYAGDVGCELTVGSFRSVFDFYLSRTKDLILITLNAQNIFSPRNFSHTRTVGGEWDMSITMFDMLGIVNHASFVHSTFHRTEDLNIEGNFVPLQPRFADKFTISLFWKNFHLAHSVSIHGSYYRSETNVERNDTQQPVCTAVAGVTLFDTFKIIYRLENYLDVQNFDFWNHIRPGRMHFLSMGFSFS
jgi:outer membrane cobalamin receptor